MGFRTVYGNSTSENGWPIVDEESCQWIIVPGTNPPVHLQIQQGQPLQLLRAWAADWNAYIEPLRDGDSACWTPGNSVATSNHLGGTAIDLNWDSHPFRQRGSLNDEQMRTMAAMEDFYEDTVFWAGRWQNPIDEMHSQVGYNSYGNPHTQDFINRKIRPDGFSTFRRGSAPPAPAVNLAQILCDAMGGSLSLDRYRELLPAAQQALAACGCNNLNRVAMWMAQLGTESGGLQWMEEIADGSEYEGRSDLGNTEPGDGRRYKGRGPIQITGRYNYDNLSEWAFSQQLVPSPKFFLDDPDQLSSDRYGFVGVVWYWTVARPQINELCDDGDLEGVTRAINGGLHGLADRRNRWQHCLGMGNSLLSLVTSVPTTPPGPTPEEDDFMSALSDAEQREMLDLLRQQSAYRRVSRSPLRHVGEGATETATGFDLNVDGNVHVLLVQALAKLGDPDSINLLREVASLDPNKYPDRAHDRQLAQAIINEIVGRASQGAAPPSGEVPGTLPAPMPTPIAIPLPTVQAEVYTPPVQQALPVVPRPAPAPPVPNAEGGLFGEIQALTQKLQNVSKQITDIVEGP